MALDPRALEEKAKKALQSAGGGFSFFSSNKEDKYQTAADYYVQAANGYRLEQLSKEAGRCFEAAASIHRDKLNEPDDAANQMIDAFKVYRKDYPQEAIRCIKAAIARYQAKGNFRRAASHMENAAEVLEENNDRKGAIPLYSDAARFYEEDGAKALANKNWLKLADIAALEGDYWKAVENYEKVADSSLDSNLMRYSVKDYWMKAGICVLATNDLVTARRNLETYKEKNPAFAKDAECRLLSDLIEAIEAGDQDAFTDKLFAYNEFSALDKWKTELFLRIKNQIQEADNEFS